MPHPPSGHAPEVRASRWRWTKWKNTLTANETPRWWLPLQVPVRIVGNLLDDNASTLFAADAEVSVTTPGVGNRAAAIFSPNGALCEIVRYNAWAFSGTTGFQPLLVCQAGTGPRPGLWSGLDLAAGAVQRSGIYGQTRPGRATVQGGRSSNTVNFGEAIRIPPNAGVQVPPVPFTVEPDQELIILNTDGAPAGTFTFTFVFWWRELD